MKLTFFTIFCSVIVITCAGCATIPRDLPPIASIHWVTYQSPTLGYRINYPDTLALKQQGDEVNFSYQGSSIFRMIFVTTAESKRRGLWATAQPMTAATIGGVAGQQYIYDHYDGPFYTHTIAYVIPFQDRWLGLEFRTTASTLSAVQQQMLDSFQLK
ncbi:MAG: hypothetical protein R3C14_11715 [Caldilineaceae bacterium]